MVFLNVYQFLPVIWLNYTAEYENGVVHLEMSVADGKSSGVFSFKSLNQQASCKWKGSTDFLATLRQQYSYGSTKMRQIGEKLPLYNEKIDNSEAKKGRMRCYYDLQASNSCLEAKFTSELKVISFEVKSRFDPFLPGIFGANFDKERKVKIYNRLILLKS